MKTPLLLRLLWFAAIVAIIPVLSAQTVVTNETEFRAAITNVGVSEIELANDIVVSSPGKVMIERSVTIRSEAPGLFTLTFQGTEPTIRNQTTPISVIFENIHVVAIDVDTDTPYGIRHMNGTLTLNNVTVSLTCGDGNFQPGLAPTAVYLHVNTTSYIVNSVINVNNTYTGATYGIYYTPLGSHTAVNNSFNLISSGENRFPFGTQNVTGPRNGPFTLTNFPTFTFSGNTAIGATHALMVFLENWNSDTQFEQAKDLIDQAIANNDPVLKSSSWPNIGQIRSAQGSRTDYPLPINNLNSKKFYLTIQDAVDDASPGDVIKIPGGSYTGNVVLPGGITLYPGNSPACVTIAGSFTSTNTDNLVMDIAYPSVCSGYTQLSISGTINLGGINLDIQLYGYIPQPGDEFVIIKNNSGLPVTGQFDQGATAFTMNHLGADVTFILEYNVGAGNDVVLKVTSVEFPAVPLSNWAIYLVFALMLVIAAFGIHKKVLS